MSSVTPRKRQSTPASRPSSIARRVAVAEHTVQVAEERVARTRQLLYQAQQVLQQRRDLLAALQDAHADHQRPPHPPPASAHTPDATAAARTLKTHAAVHVQPQPQRLPPRRSAASHKARQQALRRLATLLPHVITISASGRKRSLQVQAGTRYIVQPLDRRRRRHAGVQGLLESWDLAGTTAILRLKDGTRLAVRLEDLQPMTRPVRTRSVTSP